MPNIERQVFIPTITCNVLFFTQTITCIEPGSCQADALTYTLYAPLLLILLLFVLLRRLFFFLNENHCEMNVHSVNGRLPTRV